MPQTHHGYTSSLYLQGLEPNCVQPSRQSYRKEEVHQHWQQDSNRPVPSTWPHYRKRIPTDHAKLSSIDENGRRVTIFNKRIGRPRSKWLSSVIDRIWKLLHSNGFQSYGLYYDEANQDHIITLYGAAHDRNGPFKKPRKPGKIKDYTSKGKKGKQSNRRARRNATSPKGQGAPPSPPPAPPSPNRGQRAPTSHECGHLLSDLGKYFTTLCMVPSLDLQLVDRAYRHAARIHHPDKGGSPEEFRKVKGARDKIAEKLNNFLMRQQRSESPHIPRVRTPPVRPRQVLHHPVHDTQP